jgi:hypothetical protein
MKVLSESWELSQELGNCEPTKTTYWSAKEAYMAGARAIKDGTFHFLYKWTCSDESGIVEALHKAGMLDG